MVAPLLKSIVITSLRFAWHFFKEREVPSNLRKGLKAFFPPARSATHGTNSAHFRGALIWNQLPRSK